MRLILPKRFGPSSLLEDPDILWILWTLRAFGRIGRKNLAQALGIGEGSLRSAVSVLGDCGLVVSFQTGISLTEAGRDLADSLPIRPSGYVPRLSFGDGERSAVVVSGFRATADTRLPPGCAAVVYRAGKLTVLPDTDLLSRFPEDFKSLCSEPLLDSDGTVLVSEADDIRTSRNICTQAALDLLSMDGTAAAVPEARILHALLSLSDYAAEPDELPGMLGLDPDDTNAVMTFLERHGMMSGCSVTESGREFLDSIPIRLADTCRLTDGSFLSGSSVEAGSWKPDLVPPGLVTAVMTGNGPVVSNTDDPGMMCSVSWICGSCGLGIGDLLVVGEGATPQRALESSLEGALDSLDRGRQPPHAVRQAY